MEAEQEKAESSIIQRFLTKKTIIIDGSVSGDITIELWDFENAGALPEPQKIIIRKEAMEIPITLAARVCETIAKYQPMLMPILKLFAKDKK